MYKKKKKKKRRILKHYIKSAQNGDVGGWFFGCVVSCVVLCVVAITRTQHGTLLKNLT